MQILQTEDSTMAEVGEVFGLVLKMPTSQSPPVIVPLMLKFEGHDNDSSDLVPEDVDWIPGSQLYPQPNPAQSQLLQASE